MKAQTLCFQVLDKEKKGYLEPGELTKYMTQEGRAEAFSFSFVRLNNTYDLWTMAVLFFFNPGEVFTQDEMEEMLTAHTDQEKNVIFYKEIISKLTFEPDE